MSSRPGRDSIKEEMKIDADRVGDQIQLAQSLTHVGEYTNNEDFTHPCYWPSPKEKREGTEKAHGRYSRHPAYTEKLQAPKWKGCGI